jgi:hypothetical protein
MPRPQKSDSIVTATTSYETWLARRLRLVPADLKKKHDAMRDDRFAFFRGTYYRWAQRWTSVCDDTTDGTVVLAVGDLHVANFGTWRDAEGRLAWGVNDLDEAWRLPATNDLIRLATSARLAMESGGMRLDADTAADAILDGYREAIADRPAPFVLAEAHPALHRMATDRLKEPAAYWDKLRACKFPSQPIPSAARVAIERSIPGGGDGMRIVHRVAGMGSLGRERYVGIADWHGGLVAREAKALIVSAAAWAAGEAPSARTRYAELLRTAVRCPDPGVSVRGPWLVRRLAPDCSRIELADLPRERDEARLLHAMGREVANIHAGSATPKVLAKSMKERPRRWLRKASTRMADEVSRDWEVWRELGDR